MLTAAPQKQNQTPSQSKKSEGVFFQPKLTINQPNDIYEQEADAMADKVMRMPASNEKNNFFFKPANSIQLKCAHCEEEEKKELQRKEATSNEPGAHTSTENYISSLSGKGRSLAPDEKSFFEPRFGYDFSDVKIHDDTEAAKSAQSINALAYTTGSNIVFNQNKFSSKTENGKRLLAHELTHVVQQKNNTNLRRKIQREVLAMSDFDTQDIQPTQAIVDKDYIDNYYFDYTLRSDGSIMSPTFTAFSLFYQDGAIFDIPASSNSYFPNFADPKAPAITVYRRHTPSGKIFPITILMSDYLNVPVTPGMTVGQQQQAALQQYGKFLFLTKAGGTPNIIQSFTNEIARIAFAYAGLIGAIWNVALGIRGALQIFTLSSSLRAAAAARAAAPLGAGAAQLGGAARAGASGAAGSTLSQIVNIVRNILKNNVSGISAAETAQIAQVEGRLTTILQNAVRNVNNGTATGAWAQRLATMQPASPLYNAALGNAVHEESFNLIRQEIAAGNLPAGLTTNAGRAIPASGLPNAFPSARPDIRLPLGVGGREAIWDITTAGQAGHAAQYNTNWVEYLVELFYR